MTLPDLLFLCSLLLVIVLLGRTAWEAARGRWQATRRTASLAGVFLILYATALIAVAGWMPRRFYSPGERECFDDWCVAAISAGAGEARMCRGDGRGVVWVARLRVSSEAKRVRQRARDAAAVMEDRQGNRYASCGNTVGTLSDEVGPGESFEVRVAFLLPAGAQPAGVVVRHGAFPGVVIIGDDQSFRHAPALLRIASR